MKRLAGLLVLLVGCATPRPNPAAASLRLHNDSFFTLDQGEQVSVYHLDRQPTGWCLNKRDEAVPCSIPPMDLSLPLKEPDDELGIELNKPGVLTLDSTAGFTNPCPAERPCNLNQLVEEGTNAHLHETREQMKQTCRERGWEWTDQGCFEPTDQTDQLDTFGYDRWPTWVKGTLVGGLIVVVLWLIVRGWPG